MEEHEDDTASMQHRPRSEHHVADATYHACGLENLAKAAALSAMAEDNKVLPVNLRYLCQTWRSVSMSRAYTYIATIAFNMPPSATLNRVSKR